MAGGRPSGTTGSAQVLPTPPRTTVFKPFRSMLSTTHYHKVEPRQINMIFFLNVLSVGLRESSLIDRVHKFS